MIFALCSEDGKHFLRRGATLEDIIQEIAPALVVASSTCPLTVAGQMIAAQGDACSIQDGGLNMIRSLGWECPAGCKHPFADAMPVFHSRFATRTDSLGGGRMHAVAHPAQS